MQYPQKTRPPHLHWALLSACLALSPLALAEDPLITVQPTNQTASLGAALQFRVTVGSTNSVVTRQWQHTAVNLPEGFTNLPGATSVILRLTNVVAGHAGDYRFVASNATGNWVTSQVARLDVDLVFNKITQSPIVTDDLDGWSAAWGDYNGDGYLDVAVAGGYWMTASESTTALYTNRHDGTFARAANSPFTTASPNRIVNWADANNDGRLDLWAGSFENKTPNYYTNQGNGRFARIAVTTNWIENGVAVRGGVQAWADYDGDGLVDLVVASVGDRPETIWPISLLHNSGNGRFSVDTNSPLYQVSKSSVSASWVDIDGDGDLDLICLGGSPKAFRNHGGTMIPMSEAELPILSGARMDAWADFDNDGNLDLLGIAWGTSPQLWRNDGKGGWTLLTGPGYEAWKDVWAVHAAWGDYDNDGDLDLFLTCGEYGSTRRNHLFRNDSSAGFVEVLSGSPVVDIAASTGGCWVDYDNDGALDLFVVNGENGSLTSRNDFLYHNNGNTNHWLEIKLTGRVSNRSAIGAKVRVKALIGGKEVWQLRLITAQAWSQELVAHFGLGNADQAEVVRIEWPSGIVQEVSAVAPNQILTLEEEMLLVTSSVSEVKPGTVEVPKGGAVTLGVSTNPPNAAYQWQFNGQDIPGATAATHLIPSLSVADLGRYSLRVTTTDLGVVARPVSVVMQGQPLLLGLRAKTPTSVSLGASVVLHADVTGGAPLTLRWQQNGVDIPATLNPTATTPELRIDSATLADSGDYRLVVSNAVDALVSGVLSVRVDPTFLRINEGPGGSDSAGSMMATWADYDGDSYPDVMIANASWDSSSRNVLWRNNKDGTFTKILTGRPVLDAGAWWAPFWIDYDNDGDPDLHVVSALAGRDRFYRNDGNGVFTPATPEFLKIGAGIVVWTDLGGDGWLDVLLQFMPGNQPLTLFRGFPGGSFGSVDAGSITRFPGGAMPIDYDNDGWEDLLVMDFLTVGGKASLHHNDGYGYFRQITEGELATNQCAKFPNGLNLFWGAGDYDNDGDTDVFLLGGEDGYRSRLYRNDGNGNFTNVAKEAGVDRPLNGATDPIWIDYDNDGNLDLFVTCVTYRNPPTIYGTENVLFRNNGDGTFTSVEIGSPLRDGVRRVYVGPVDYDHDGFMDLFMTNGDTVAEQNYLYHNNLKATGNTNHWLEVKLVGKASNSMGVGAKIRVTATIRGRVVHQLREIRAPGWGGQEDFLAHFGLGDATKVDSVRIEWPSGIVQELTNVAVDQKPYLPVTETQNAVSHPQILSSRRAADGTFEVTVKNTELKLMHVLEASTDLIKWSKSQVRTNLVGTMEFTDTSANGAAARFYRVVVP